MDIRKLTADEVEVVLETEADDLEMARFDSGEPEYDEEDRRQIIERIEQGDQWAWFRATVTVKWGMFEATDSLGGCNYASEEDFRNDDYFANMVSEALDRLNEKIEEAARAISFLFRSEDPLHVVNRDLVAEVERNKEIRRQVIREARDLMRMVSEHGDIGAGLKEIIGFANPAEVLG